jgi:hypothetical protein
MIRFGALGIAQTHCFPEVWATKRSSTLQTLFFTSNAFTHAMERSRHHCVRSCASVKPQNAASGSSPIGIDVGSSQSKPITYYKRVLPDPPCIDFSGSEGAHAQFLFFCFSRSSELATLQTSSKPLRKSQQSTVLDVPCMSCKI